MLNKYWVLFLFLPNLAFSTTKFTKQKVFPGITDDSTNLTVTDSSITLSNNATFYFNNSNSALIYSSPTVCSTFLMMPAGGYVLRTSITANATASQVIPTFEVLNTIPDSTTIHGALIRGDCSTNQDAGADAGSVFLYMRQTGGVGVSNSVKTQVCTVDCELASESCRDSGFVFIPSTGPIDFSCATAGTVSQNLCRVTAIGYCR